jgi:hypothetical protein
MRHRKNVNRFRFILIIQPLHIEPEPANTCPSEEGWWRVVWVFDKDGAV